MSPPRRRRRAASDFSFDDVRADADRFALVAVGQLEGRGTQPERVWMKMRELGYRGPDESRNAVTRRLMELTRRGLVVHERERFVNAVWSPFRLTSDGQSWVGANANYVLHPELPRPGADEEGDDEVESEARGSTPAGRACGSCGSFVVDSETHARWHKEMGRLVDVAVEQAVRAAEARVRKLYTPSDPTAGSSFPWEHVEEDDKP